MKSAPDSTFKMVIRAKQALQSLVTATQNDNRGLSAARDLAYASISELQEFERIGRRLGIKE